MEITEYIKKNVAECYWRDNLNCATTMLNILAKTYRINLENQVINAAIGMHGAGSFGAQCGLVEGALMFIGIFGKEKGLPNETIIDLAYCYAQEFETHFASLVCKKLRPQGFKPDNPPHLCEKLTNQAVKFAIEYLEEKLHKRQVIF
jgi:C_GCAxxG_C_C family probable redox protein